MNALSLVPDLATALSLNGHFEGQSFTFETADPDIVAALQRYESAQMAVPALLRIGACATLATATGLDVAAIQRELDRAIGQARVTLDGFSTHVSESVGADGPLAATLSAARTELDRTLQDLVARQADPDQPGSLLARLQAATRRFDEMVEAARKQMAEDLRNQAERQSEQLSRHLRDMRDLDPSSALGGAFARLEAGLRDVQAAVAASQSAAMERQRGTAKGAEYEELVAGTIAGVAAANGDLAERTGSQPGAVILNKKASLRGDVTVTIEPDVATVWEAMNRSSAVLTAKAVKEELDEAMRNRAAQAAVAVVASADNHLMCGQPLQTLGPNLWAVALDADAPNPLALQVAYTLARGTALALARASQHDAVVDLGPVKQGVQEISRALALLDEVSAQLSNIRGCESKASLALGRYQRDISTLVARVVGYLEGAAECDEQQQQQQAGQAIAA